MVHDGNVIGRHSMSLFSSFHEVLVGLGEAELQFLLALRLRQAELQTRQVQRTQVELRIRVPFACRRFEVSKSSFEVASDASVEFQLGRVSVHGFRCIEKYVSSGIERLGVTRHLRTAKEMVGLFDVLVSAEAQEVHEPHVVDSILVVAFDLESLFEESVGSLVLVFSAFVRQGVQALESQHVGVATEGLVRHVHSVFDVRQGGPASSFEVQRFIDL